MKMIEPVQTTIVIPRALQKEVQEYREKTGTSMSTVARMAFRDFLDAQKIKARLSEAA